MRLSSLLARFDRFQQRHSSLGFPLAVWQKYADDQGGYLAAGVTYYAFFSLFPLLLASTTILGFVLHSHPALETRILHSALAQLPIVGNEIKTRSLNGSTFGLVIGLVAAVWAGMRGVMAFESALSQLWGVPFTRRPDALRARARALVLLLVLGVAVLATATLSAAGEAANSYGLLWRVPSIGLSTLLNFGLIWVALRVVTSADVLWSELRVGAAVAAIGYEALQVLGSYYVQRVVNSAGNTYGTFALVIGLLSFIYVAVHICLLATEASVVASHRLWPRSFSAIVEQPATTADIAARSQEVEAERRRNDERIRIDIPVRDAAPRRDP
jgi:inner membrane protein YhjD